MVSPTPSITIDSSPIIDPTPAPNIDTAPVAPRLKDKLKKLKCKTKFSSLTSIFLIQTGFKVVATYFQVHLNSLHDNEK